MYEFKEHTGDIKIRAYGKDCKEAVESLLNGVIETIEKKEGERVEKTFSFKEEFEEGFIVGLIDDFLFNIEKENIIPFSVKLKKIDYDKFYVEYTIKGVNGIPENIIKAATFHDLKIRKEKGCEIEVVLDV